MVYLVVIMLILMIAFLGMLSNASFSLRRLNAQIRHLAGRQGVDISKKEYGLKMFERVANEINTEEALSIYNSAKVKSKLFVVSLRLIIILVVLSGVFGALLNR